MLKKINIGAYNALMPSHYPNWCWLIINKIPYDKIQHIFVKTEMFLSIKLFLVLWLQGHCHFSPWNTRVNDDLGLLFKLTQWQLMTWGSQPQAALNNSELFQFSPLVIWHRMTTTCVEENFKSIFCKISLAWDPFQKHGLTLIPAWISNHMPSKVR